MELESRPTDLGWEVASCSTKTKERGNEICDGKD